MDIYLVFNQLSLSTVSQAADVYDANEWMGIFLEVLEMARKHRVQFRTRRDFLTLELVARFTINDWYNSPDLEIEQKRRFRSMATQNQYLEDFPDEIIGQIRGMDFSWNQIRCDDFGLAYLLGGLSVSLPTSQEWDFTQTEILVSELYPNEGETVIRQQGYTIHHISLPHHWDAHTRWLERNRELSINDGMDILKQWEGLFPSLVLVDKARKQIRDLSSGKPQLHQLIDRLFEFQRYCSNWKDGDFDYSEIRLASRESDGVWQNRRLRNLRMFKCPDGEERYFEWHVRLTPNAWRLHFFPDIDSRTIIIGYIGPHLETATY